MNLAWILRGFCVFTGIVRVTRILPDSVGTEVRVGLVESDSVPHRVDSVVKLVDGFVELLAVLILLPFVVS